MINLITVDVFDYSSSHESSACECADFNWTVSLLIQALSVIHAFDYVSFVTGRLFIV